MNAHEREVLENFLNQLTEIRGVSKDPEACSFSAHCSASAWVRNGPPELRWRWRPDPRARAAS
jgi:hypothetical protein